MLAIVAIAYTGKALHTHSDSYYDSLRTTKSAASNGMSDDCPICHFNLLLYTPSEIITVSFFSVLTVIFFAIEPTFHSKVITHILNLRGPPAVL